MLYINITLLWHIINEKWYLEISQRQAYFALKYLFHTVTFLNNNNFCQLESWFTTKQKQQKKKVNKIGEKLKEQQIEKKEG